MFDVTGKVVIVTGGNKGIGEGVARKFAQADAKVAIFGRNPADNQKVCEDIVAQGGQCVPSSATSATRHRSTPPSRAPWTSTTAEWM